MRTIVPEARSCNAVVGRTAAGAFCVTLIREDGEGHTQLSQHGQFAVRDDAACAGSMMVPTARHRRLPWVGNLTTAR